MITSEKSKKEKILPLGLTDNAILKKDIENDLRWGVYIVIKAKNEYVKNCFKDYGMVTDSSGNYSAIWRHIII